MAQKKRKQGARRRGVSEAKRRLIHVQQEMNEFTEKYLENFPKLRVDGDRGPATNRRIQTCKWYLGYSGDPQHSSRVTTTFRRRLNHPKDPDRFPRKMMRAAEERRKHQRERERKPPTSGVGTFDGRKCANWLIPYLQWARQHGWDGTLVSGWRDPEYSEQLCYQICGAPRCSGRCAGKSSNHVGSSKPRGALDVSYYSHFGQLMRSCPHSPRIFNGLGAADPVHFSATGN